MDQPRSGKREISRNCGVREGKHAAAVELQMPWVSDTRFPQPEKRAESINSPWGMNPSSPLPHSGLPHTSPAAHRGHNPHWWPPPEKGAHPHPHLGMGSGRGNQEHQHWSFPACFVLIILSWSKNSWDPSCLGHLGFSCHPATRLGVLALGHGWAIPWWCPRGRWLRFTPASHKTSSSWGTTICDVEKPWKCWAEACLRLQHPHWGRARLFLNRSQPAACSQTSFLHPRYFQVLSRESKWPETFRLEERKKKR